MKGEHPSVLFSDVPGILATSVECPNPRCFARVGWACSDCHCYGSHRQRIRASLVKAGVTIVRRRVYVPEAHPFFLDLKTGRYFDRVPGYQSEFFMRRESGGVPVRRSDYRYRAPDAAKEGR